MLHRLIWNVNQHLSFHAILFRCVSGFNLVFKTLIISLIFFSCSKELEKDEFIRWVNNYENGLHVKKDQGDFSFDVQLEPAAYHSLIRNDGSATQKDDLQYYTLKINLKDPAQDILLYNVSDITGKQQNLYYYSYLFQNDIFLEENNTKLPCVLFHFEQSDLSKARTFVLGFENPHQASSQEAKLILNSQQFGSLPIKIQISKRNIPSLKL